MAASGYTPISLYYSSTAAATPTAGNLVNGELAINITDGKLYYKDNAGAVQLLASKNPTVASIASSASITPDGSVTQYNVTALATNATINAPSGTPVSGQKLVIRIQDNGTPQTLSWSTSAGAYAVVGVTLPTTTIANKVLYVGCIYNSESGYWNVVATSVQV